MWGDGGGAGDQVVVVRFLGSGMKLLIVVMMPYHQTTQKSSTTTSRANAVSYRGRSSTGVGNRRPRDSLRSQCRSVRATGAHRVRPAVVHRHWTGHHWRRAGRRYRPRAVPRLPVSVARRVQARTESWKTVSGGAAWRATGPAPAQPPRCGRRCCWTGITGREQDRRRLPALGGSMVSERGQRVNAFSELK
jgi:hypothetical protein